LGVGNAIGATVWLSSLAFPESALPFLRAGATLLLISTFAFATWSLSFRPYYTAHVAERYGLFTIIVLGESIVVTVAGLDTGSNVIAALVAALVAALAAGTLGLAFYARFGGGRHGESG